MLTGYKRAPRGRASTDGCHGANLPLIPHAHGMQAPVAPSLDHDDIPVCFMAIERV